MTFERSELASTLQRVRIPSFIVSDARIVWLNDAATSVFGDVVGREVSAVVVPEDMPIVERQWELKREGAAVTDYEVHLVLVDGRRVVAEISSVPMRGSDVAHGVFGVIVSLDAEDGVAPLPELTRRQNDVLRLLDEGRSTQEIARALSLSKETVRNYVGQILRALGAHSRLEAVAVARRRRAAAAAS